MVCPSNLQVKNLIFLVQVAITWGILPKPFLSVALNPQEYQNPESWADTINHLSIPLPSGKQT